ncbi:MAG: FeS assembly SUF system protein, partial [Rikenellaceae bacterium]
LEQVNSETSMVMGVTKVNVILVFDPQWDRSMISEEALLELGLL